MGPESRSLRCFVAVVTRTSVIVLATLLGTSAAVTQTRTGNLLGLIQDPQHKVVSGVEVQLSRADAGSQPVFHTITDVAGRFEFPRLSAGVYSLELTLTGWRPQRFSHLRIEAARTLDVHIVLAPAQASGSQRDPSLSVFDREVVVSRRFGQVSMHELPTARTIWSLLENQGTSTVTNRFDNGALASGTLTLFGARAVSWTENKYDLNGFDVTDPYLPGRALVNPDFDALTDVTVITAAKPDSLSGSGANLILNTPPTDAILHGNIQGFFSNHALQSDNMNSRLVQQGFPGPERLRYLVDGSGQLGGELPLNPAWPFFMSLSTQQLSQTLGGFDAPIDTRVYHLLTEFTPFSRGGKQLNLFYAAQHFFNSSAGADPLIASTATPRSNDTYQQLQTSWSSSPSASSTLEIGFGLTDAVVSSHSQPDSSTSSTIDLPSLTLSGAAPFLLSGSRARYQANAQLGLIHHGTLGSHSAMVGAEFDRSNITNRWAGLGQNEQVLVEGIGAEVVRWSTPTQARQHVNNFAFFAQDAWRPAQWLAIPIGVRVEYSSGQSAAASNRTSWTTVEPRIGLVIRLPLGGLVLRGGYARYGHLFQGTYLDFGNSAALGGQVFQWLDLNRDRQFQSPELGQLLRVFGGPYSAVDAGLRRPVTDEITAEVVKQFGDHFVTRARFFRRDDRHLVGIVNTGVPASSYVPTLVIDPGTDGIVGTADDQTLTLFNRMGSALGKDFFVLTNPAGYRSSDKGLEIEMLKPFARHWEIAVNFSAMHASAPTSPGNSVYQNDPGFIITDQSVFSELNADPNTLLFATGRTYFDRGFTGNLIASYEAPHQFKLAVVARYYDGLAFGRLLFVNGFEQGPFFVRATPRGDFGAFRTQLNSTLDLRIARTSNTRHGTISLMLDFFNLLNLNKSTQQADLTSPTFSQRIPLAIQTPRTARVGLEWRW